LAVLNAAHVFGPTTPSASKPLSLWKSKTAPAVPEPKSPSAPAEPQEYPKLINNVCNSLTAAPSSPSERILLA
jgi:hypothetical protein